MRLMSSASFKASEPSMEDILASIRRIISDDQDTIRAPEDEDEEREAPSQNDIVRNVITNIVGVYGKDQPAPEVPPTVRPAARPAPEPEEPLLSSEADASVADAF